LKLCEAIMDAYFPDFTPYWKAPAAEDHHADDDQRVQRENQAMAELTERVNAARSIV
jgi:hypothetical protein